MNSYTGLFLHYLYDWQTLIAGIFALLAAYLTIHATNRAADREINAAVRQTEAAQAQTATAIQLEQQRVAREGFAFMNMMEAAMSAVVIDIELARREFGHPTDANDLNFTERAYRARQRIMKNGFAELRGACIRFGDQLTTPFLGLDNEIDIFKSQWTEVPSMEMGPYKVAPNAGTIADLERFGNYASGIRQIAIERRKNFHSQLIGAENTSVAS